ncbi:unnamed protein product [Amoebophrya sp. A120]|nr:unnamed protein product [Amoebophrya sp. A120]|eukprot:GSA120T00017194001.1
MPRMRMKKTTTFTLLAGAQLAAALKQAGEEAGEGQKMAIGSAGEGAVRVVHSPRTNEMREDRAGTSARHSKKAGRSKTQSFNEDGIMDHDDEPPYINTMKIHLGRDAAARAEDSATTHADMTVPPISIRLTMLNPFGTGYLEEVSETPVSDATDGKEPGEDGFLEVVDENVKDLAEAKIDAPEAAPAIVWSVDTNTTQHSASTSVTDVNLLQPEQIEDFKKQAAPEQEHHRQESAAWSWPSLFGDDKTPRTVAPDTITVTVFDSSEAQLICTATIHPPKRRSSGGCNPVTMFARTASFGASQLGIGFEFAVDLDQSSMTFTSTGIDWGSTDRYVGVAKTFFPGLGQRPQEAVLRFAFPGRVDGGGSGGKEEWKLFTRDLHIQVKL